MGKSYKIDLEIENGYALLMGFDAMKKLQQESSLIDEQATISYKEKVKITAGLYDTFEELDDIFMSIITRDKELVKKHISDVLSTEEDPEVKRAAIENICESMKNMNQEFSKKEKE